jgi:hypothetical protein
MFSAALLALLAPSPPNPDISLYKNRRKAVLMIRQ